MAARCDSPLAAAVLFADRAIRLRKIALGRSVRYCFKPSLDDLKRGSVDTETRTATDWGPPWGYTSDSGRAGRPYITGFSRSCLKVAEREGILCQGPMDLENCCKISVSGQPRWVGCIGSMYRNRWLSSSGIRADGKRFPPSWHFGRWLDFTSIVVALIFFAIVLSSSG